MFVRRKMYHYFLGIYLTYKLYEYFNVVTVVLKPGCYLYKLLHVGYTKLSN